MKTWKKILIIIVIIGILALAYIPVIRYSYDLGWNEGHEYGYGKLANDTYPSEDYRRSREMNLALCIIYFEENPNAMKEIEDPCGEILFNENNYRKAAEMIHEQNLIDWEDGSYK